jgi:hypothetical protein
MLQLRFNQAFVKQPMIRAKAINDFVEQTRTNVARDGRIWFVILFFTVVPGFLSALILIYNIFAGLMALGRYLTATSIRVQNSSEDPPDRERVAVCLSGRTNHVV